MIDPNDAAFARPLSRNNSYDEGSYDQTGLTKREYFAGQAMAAVGSTGSAARMLPEQFAKHCVSLADALIEELNK